MQAKYDTIGVGYNETRKADPYLASRLYHHLSPEAGKTYLDIGCGTGNYTIALHEKGVNFIGVDPSEEMLSQARQASSGIEWKTGTAENIPLEDASVNGVIANLTIHHWPDLNQGFAEINRVMKPGSKLVIFTSSPEQMQGYWLNYYFPDLMQKGTEQMPPFYRIRELLDENGMEVIDTEAYEVRQDLEDLFLYCHKSNPEGYFDAQYRKGISTFADLGNQQEIEEGLSRMRSDIDSGTINQIIANYMHDEGDYLYVVAEKSAED